MKNNKLFTQKAITLLLLVIAIFSVASLDAQFGINKEYDPDYPGRNASQYEMHAFLKKKIRQSIELADYTALIYVPNFSANASEAYDCFYGENGKTIYTAVKVLLKHDYKGNFVSKNKEAIVVVKGGIIGDDNQLHPFGDQHIPFVRLKTGGTYLLTASSPPEKFHSRFREDIPVYFIVFDQISIAEGQNSEIQTYGFSTEDEFDSFVYKELKKVKRKRKKKDVGFGESSTRVLGVITSISPTVIHAGVGEVLTIKGTGLPTSKSDLKVYFLNSDKPFKKNGNPNFVSVDPYYIQSVSSTAGVVTIKVIVPSNFSSMDIDCAGSGKIQVVDISTSPETITTSTQDVNIEYAIRNYGVPTSSIDTRAYLAQQYCINGFVFTLHNSVKSYPAAIPVIEQALDDWSNKLSMTGKKFVFELEKDLNGDLVYISDTTNEKRNIIFFSFPRVDWINKFVTRMYCEPHSDHNNVQAQKYFTKRMDVYISKPVSDNSGQPLVDWDYSLSGNLPAGKNDFYQTLLHELGHGIGLDHIIDLAGNPALMTSEHNPGPLSSANRINLTQHSLRAIQGTTRNRNDSQNLPDWNKESIKTLNQAEATIYATPIIGTNDQPFVWPSPGWSFNPPFNFWIDNYSGVFGLSGRICTSNFDYLWKWRVGTVDDEKYADCLANPGGLQGTCNNRVSYVSARILDASYEDTGTCSGASLESLPKHISYWNCRLKPGKSPLKRGLKPFPNPTNGFVTVQILWGNAPKLEGSFIEVYKENGNKIIEQDVMIADMIKQFDLSPYQDGTYFVLWRKGNTVYDTSEIQLIRN